MDQGYSCAFRLRKLYTSFFRGHSLFVHQDLCDFTLLSWPWKTEFPVSGSVKSEQHQEPPGDFHDQVIPGTRHYSFHCFYLYHWCWCHLETLSIRKRWAFFLLLLYPQQAEVLGQRSNTSHSSNNTESLASRSPGNSRWAFLMGLEEVFRMKNQPWDEFFNLKIKLNLIVPDCFLL